MRRRFQYRMMLGMVMVLTLIFTGCGNQGAKSVAVVNDQQIAQSDLEFYKLISQIQIAMIRHENTEKKSENDQKVTNDYIQMLERQNMDRNSLLTQIIRLQAVAMLAKEKGYLASPEEINQELSKVKQMYAPYPEVAQLIKQYGEEQFWEKEKSQYELIVLSQKVQKDMIDKVTKDNPKMGAKEVVFQAQKEYEDLLQSQIGSLKIKIR